MDIIFACRSNRYCAWLVESSRKGTFYLVQFDVNFRFSSYYPKYREGWHCECPAFMYRDHELCKHIRAKKVQKCDWDQSQQKEISTEPVRKNDGSLLCPVCEGDVYTYIPPVQQDAEF